MADTIFDSIIPTSCVNPQLQTAGFCALQKGCADACFGQSTNGIPSFENVANLFSLESVGLQNFYIPVDAVECDQMEEPICPATICCPACKDEINELFRCIIIEGNYHYLDYLAESCPLDCQDFDPSEIQKVNNDVQGKVEDPVSEDPFPPTSVDNFDSNVTDVDWNMTDIDDVGLEMIYFDDMDSDTTDLGQGGTTEFDVVEKDLEKNVVVIVSSPDAVTVIDNRHNTTTVVGDEDEQVSAPEDVSEAAPVQEDTTEFDVVSNGLEVDIVEEAPTVGDTPDVEAVNEETTEIDVIENDLEKNVIKFVSSSDSVTIVDPTHGTTTTFVDKTPP